MLITNIVERKKRYKELHPPMKANPLLAAPKISDGELQRQLKAALIAAAPKATIEDLLAGLHADKIRCRNYTSAKEAVAPILNDLDKNWSQFKYIINHPELKYIPVEQADYVGTLIKNNRFDTLLEWINAHMPAPIISPKTGKNVKDNAKETLQQILRKIIALWPTCYPLLDIIIQMRNYINEKACIKAPDVLSTPYPEVLSSLYPALHDFADLLKWVEDEKPLHSYYTELNVDRCIQKLTRLEYIGNPFNSRGGEEGGPFKFIERCFRISPTGSCSDLQIIAIQSIKFIEHGLGVLTYKPLFQMVFPFPIFMDIVRAENNPVQVVSLSFEVPNVGYRSDILPLKLYTNDRAVAAAGAGFAAVKFGGTRLRRSSHRRSGANKKSTRRQIRNGSR